MNAVNPCDPIDEHEAAGVSGNVLHSVNVPGNAHDVVSYINKSLPEFVDGLVLIQTHGYNSVFVVRGTQQQIDTAKAQGRL